MKSRAPVKEFPESIYGPAKKIAEASERQNRQFAEAIYHGGKQVTEAIGLLNKLNKEFADYGLAAKGTMEAINRQGNQLTKVIARLNRQNKGFIEAILRIPAVPAYLTDKSRPEYHLVQLICDGATEAECEESARWLADRIWKGRPSMANPRAQVGMHRLREQLVGGSFA